MTKPQATEALTLEKLLELSKDFPPIEQIPELHIDNCTVCREPLGEGLQLYKIESVEFFGRKTQPMIIGLCAKCQKEARKSRRKYPHGR